VIAYQQRDRAQGVHRRRFDHTGCARFQIDGAVNVQSLVARWSVKSDFGTFGAQQPAGRTSCVGCTQSANSTGFIIAQIVEQIWSLSP